MQTDQLIQFHYLTRRFTLTKRNKLKIFIKKLITNEGGSIAHINYIFCSDRYLLQINKKYLNHNSYTDIITFELSPSGSPLISDVYISIDRVRKNCRRFGTSFTQELHRVIFHGALHLCGYKDKTALQLKKMRVKERIYLDKYFVSREIKNSKS